jgi:hypothetical protein
MDFENLIGLPVEVVKHKLDEMSIKYIVTESSGIQKKYDTLLAVQIKLIKDDLVEIVADKFLLDV